MRLSYTEQTEGGQPPFDPVLMFKSSRRLPIFPMNAPNFLSMTGCRFMRFLGLGLQDRVPDSGPSLSDAVQPNRNRRNV
jgi:hypothetical protein